MRKTERRKSTTDKCSRFKWPTYENLLSLFPHIFIFVLFVSSGEKRTTGREWCVLEGTLEGIHVLLGV